MEIYMLKMVKTKHIESISFYEKLIFFFKKKKSKILNNEIFYIILYQIWKKKFNSYKALNN